MATTNYSLNKPTVGASENTWGGDLNDNFDSLDSLLSGGSPINGINLVTFQVNGVSVSATAAELNILDGVTATTAELNYVDGVTSNIQSQLNGKVDDSQVLTDVPANAVFTDTIYTKPASEPISYISGLQAALDDKIGDTNPTTTGTMTHTGTKEYRDPSTATGYTYVTFENIGGTTTYGSIARNLNSISYNTGSDYRLKENVAPVVNAIERVKDLSPCRFNFIGSTHIVDGFLAHEAQAVVPESVTGDKDAVDSDGNPVYQGIDQSKLVPLLTAALQEAIARIEALENQG